jgi:hypothetical protein
MKRKTEMRKKLCYAVVGNDDDDDGDEGDLYDFKFVQHKNLLNDIYIGDEEEYQISNSRVVYLPRIVPSSTIHCVCGITLCHNCTHEAM